MRGTFKTGITLAVVSGLVAAPAAMGQWVEFVDETNDRLIAAPEFGANDSAEKDYQWADLDKDGWIDLVVMRRTANNGTGAQRQNTLFMNENGVLVDRTEEYASASDVSGDQGFLTPVSDRQATIVDVDNDGWMDVVTAPSLNNGQPKHISHPRVYMNLGESGSGEWLGLRYEDARIPVLACCDGSVPHAPRLCGIASGDVTGDGYADLYLSDYSTGSVCAGCPSATFDFEDMLLVNEGQSNPGHFQNETNSRVQTVWPATGVPANHSNFGTHTLMVDFNGNGLLDIMKTNSLAQGSCCPYASRIMYNDPNNVGTYNQSHQVGASNGAPYFIMAADLNNNGRMDLVVGDDGTDRYAFNQGNLSSGMVDWSSTQFLPNSGGFRSNIVIADLNNNGFKDILTASVDVDLYGWNRQDGFHRNNGDTPNVTFSWDSGNISSGALFGAYDFAVFDLTGNGWNDIVRGWGSGQSNGGQVVYINQPQFGINITFDNQPAMVDPDTPTDVFVEVDAFPSGETLDSATMYYSIDGGAFQSTPLTNVSGDEYMATIPGIECGSTIEYYFEASLAGSGFTVTEPINAPTVTFNVTAATGTEVTFTDDISGDVSGWTVENDPSLQSGAWEQATPNPVLFAFPSTLAQPDGSNTGTMSFITENCPDDSDLMGCSVSLGPTRLISPVLNLKGFDAIISYDRWFFCNHEGVAAREDVLVTEVSNDGGQTWTFVNETAGTNQEWESVQFVVSNYVEPTNEVRLRFSVEDSDDTSVTNAVIDQLSIEEFVCGDVQPACPGDITGSEVVDVDDLLVVLNNWGSCGDPNDCPADIDNSGAVDVDDLLVVLNNWGPCPE